MFKVPPSSCPDCGAVNDGCTAASADEAPAPGDFTVCIHCAGIAVFKDDLTLRAPEEDDILNMPPEINEVQHLIKHMQDQKQEADHE